jgi:hypothetical protein
LVADLANRRLDAATIDALVADLVAGMYGHWGTAAHTLQLTRVVPSSTLQLSDRDLATPAIGPHSREPGAAEVVSRLDSLADALRSAVPPLELPPYAPRRASVRSSRTTVAAALEARALEVLPGLRVDEADVTAEPTGVRLVGPADVVGGRPGERRIVPLVLAAGYPQSRLTEPGDVVFCTAPHPAAWVDPEGGSVAVFPAKVLRCRDDRFVPVVVAADINAQSEAAKAWRAWALRQVPADQSAVLSSATDAIARHRADLRDHLANLEQFSDALITAAADGSLDLNDVEGT